MEEPVIVKKKNKFMETIKKQSKTIVMILVSVLVIAIGSSYALLRSSQVGTNSYTINSGNLEVTFVDQSTDALTVTNMYPMTDTEGLAQTDELTFVVKNTGSLKATYNVYIEETSTSPAFKTVIRYVDKKGTNEYSSPKVLNDNKYIDKEASLDVNEEATYKVKLWLAEEADTTYMNKTFRAKIVVEAMQHRNKNEVIEFISKNSPIQDDTNIKFYQVNGTTNGNGLFIRHGTEADNYPIYYFRGNINNNNLIFANFCWKIVRTTETGGTKLIYNGEPTVVGDHKECLATTGTDTQLSGTSAFNSSYNSPAYVGYSLPASNQRYTYVSSAPASGAYFGSSVDVTTGKLVDPQTSLDEYHHYTYNSTNIDEVQTNVRYYYYTNYYMSFDRTKTIEDILDEMLHDDTNVAANESTIANKINTWYDDYIKPTANNDNIDYGAKLEDTIWCNDRSVSTDNLEGWNPNGGSTSTYLYFDGFIRYSNSTGTNGIQTTNTPILSCSNQNDRLSVANGKLKNPVALLTADEVALSGGVNATSNSNYYLYTGECYWLLSPAYFYYGSANSMDVNSTGNLYNDFVNSTRGARPALSLKLGTEITGGNGTSSSPYIVE